MDDHAQIVKLKEILEKTGETNDRVLRALKRLNQFHMSVELLQSTGIGKAVNQFRKNEQVGPYAKALVSKWKQDVAKVIAETAESEMTTSAELTPSRKRSVSPEAEARSPKRAKKESESEDGLMSFEDHMKRGDDKKRASDKGNGHRSDKSDGKHEKSQKSDRHEKSQHRSDKHERSSKDDQKSEKTRDDSKSKSSREKEHSSREKHGDKEKSRHSESSREKSSKHGESSREKSRHSESSRNSDGSRKDKESRDRTKDKESLRDKSKHSESKHRESSKSRHREEKESSKHHDKHSREKSKHGESSKESQSFNMFTNSELSSGSSSDSKKPKKERKSTLPKFDVPNPVLQVGLREADILASLPQTVTNYKPLPHINPDSPSKRRVNEEEIGTKKHSRSVMYSGRKTRTVSEVPKLFDACIEVLMDNIDSIDNVGGIPYFVLKPVLQKCTSEQLYNIENLNPHLLEDTGELWLDHCKTDFRGKERNADDCETWREMYLRLHDAREQKLKKLTANISAQQHAKKGAVSKTKLAFVDVIAKPPRDVLRKQRLHGTGGPVHKTVDPLEKLSSRGGEPGKSTIRAPIMRNQVTNEMVSPPSVRPAAVSKKPKAAPMMANVKKMMRGMRR